MLEHETKIEIHTLLNQASSLRAKIVKGSIDDMYPMSSEENNELKSEYYMLLDEAKLWIRYLQAIQTGKS